MIMFIKPHQKKKEIVHLRENGKEWEQGKEDSHGSRRKYLQWDMGGCFIAFGWGKEIWKKSWELPIWLCWKILFYDIFMNLSKEL